MVTFEITEDCTYCWGTGKNPAYVPEGGSQAACPKCNGTGRVESGQIDDIEAALTTLQADMSTIKAQVQALYDDLNP